MKIVLAGDDYKYLSTRLAALKKNLPSYERHLVNAETLSDLRFTLTTSSLFANSGILLLDLEGKLNKEILQFFNTYLPQTTHSFILIINHKLGAKEKLTIKDVIVEEYNIPPRKDLGRTVTSYAQQLGLTLTTFEVSQLVNVMSLPYAEIQNRLELLALGGSRDYLLSTQEGGSDFIAPWDLLDLILLRGKALPPKAYAFEPFPTLVYLSNRFIEAHTYLADPKGSFITTLSSYQLSTLRKITNSYSKTEIVKVIETLVNYDFYLKKNAEIELHKSLLFNIMH